MIKNIKITFAYDGAEFSGLQTQKGLKTVQEEIEKAIYKITNKKSRLVTAGRTDAGVHAIKTVANFLTNSQIPAEAFKYHLTKYLPDSIVMIDSCDMDLSFHSRFSAKSKLYKYIVYNDEFMHPNLRKTYAHVTYKLDIENMQNAANLLVGKHDFKAFTKYENRDVNTIRSIDRIDIYQKDKLIYFEFEAESFLYNQVRIMVGTLINIGRGHREVEYIKELLESRDRLKAGMTISPYGLYLVEIKY
ncbi:MAG: tRNA pseudouridine(38-40) synthase TruA [Tissierellia bacterium]|nr:tRNA pseudouridine(38-40) synthase TruA [Tissierellia bacterium]